MTTLGRHNPRIAEVRLALRSGRLTGDGWLVVEGPHLVDEALRTGIEIGEVYLGPDATAPPGAGAVHRLGAAAFSRLEATRHGQGLVALVRPPRFSLDDILGRAGLVLVLCGLQDPGNVGAILRLGDAFGCAGLVALEGTAGFYNDKVVRASAGSVFRLPHVAASSFGEIQVRLRAAGIGIVGTAADAAQLVASYDWRRPTAILVGNEGAGLSADERAASDVLLRIPMPGAAESLNTAQAAAIVLYEARRGRTP
jgi:TrmH family RNA methyltransferase